MPNGRYDNLSTVDAATAGLRELLQQEIDLTGRLENSAETGKNAIRDELKLVYYRQALIYHHLLENAHFLYGSPSPHQSLSEAFAACQKALTIDPEFEDANNLKSKLMSYKTTRTTDL